MSKTGTFSIKGFGGGETANCSGDPVPIALGVLRYDVTLLPILISKC